MNSFLTSALEFFDSIVANPDALSATGTWAGVVVAAAVGIYARRAWKTSQHQLKVTRDIALNDQRVPRLSELLEVISLRFGSKPEFKDVVSIDASQAEVLRLHDRWALTYPEIYRSGHFRNVIERFGDLTLIQIHLSNSDARTRGGTLKDVSEFAGKRHDAEVNLASKIDSVKQLCLDLHNDDLTESEGNERLRVLADKLKDDVAKFGALTPMWKISSISQLF